MSGTESSEAIARAGIASPNGDAKANASLAMAYRKQFSKHDMTNIRLIMCK
ncbi:MAG: hypothetical protein ACFB02_06780 [Mastigocoleus sp.]